ncbi:MAG: tRNA 2-selenouridine synthase [Chlamydiales bacterium]|nr:tRNA 2-selenouridine synthase [Chlamydiales bacterium]MCH9635710.1 tRNA 2-selenouridine synthase [Chlamydiales bacterium]MCH9703551.1 tRNA 2-selenouridine(34) synthase MnmH [Chlamydiota bacterium]
MLVDVRSPAEFAHAHIPGAHNIPLLDNEQRHLVGLCYKQKGQDQAVILGLKLAGPKLAQLVEEAKQFDQIEVYCWRGGMRSNFMAKLFSMAGIETSVREGGYKSFRKEVLQILKRDYNLRILTGLTGSGKTEVLQEKPQFIDLENLANHRGSAFGYIGPQPSNEQLENLLATKLLTLNAKEEIWVEDESRVIGSCKLPDDFFHQMMRAPRTEIDCPLDERVKRLVTTYGPCGVSHLKEGILQLTRRLGHERTQKALSLLVDNDLDSCFRLLLEYYDKAYEKSQKRYNKSDEYALRR